MVEAKYSRFVNREIITSNIEMLEVYERLAVYSGSKLPNPNRKGYSRKTSLLSTKNLLQKLLKAICVGGRFVSSIRIYIKN